MMRSKTQTRSRTSRRRQTFRKVRHCFFCQESTLPDYKKTEILRRFLSERGKIIPAERTGLCPKHQRKLSYAIKRSRYLGLLPFVVGVK